jgi:hypothetical protein
MASTAAIILFSLSSLALALGAAFLADALGLIETGS